MAVTASEGMAAKTGDERQLATNLLNQVLQSITSSTIFRIMNTLLLVFAATVTSSPGMVRSAAFASAVSMKLIESASSEDNAASSDEALSIQQVDSQVETLTTTTTAAPLLQGLLPSIFGFGAPSLTGFAIETPTTTTTTTTSTTTTMTTEPACVPVFEVQGPVETSGLNLIHTFPQWGRHFKVEFDLTSRISDVQKIYRVFYFAANIEWFNDQPLPAVSIWKSKFVVSLFLPVPGNEDPPSFYIENQIVESVSVEIGRKYHFEINVYTQDGKGTASLQIDGTQVFFSDLYGQTRDYTNVKLYATWNGCTQACSIQSFTPQDGVLENLKAFKDCEPVI